MVTFIDYEKAKTSKEELKNFVSPKSVELYGVDGYIIIVYPGSNKSHFLNQLDRSYWMDHFGKTKPNRQRKRIAKGFLEIII